MFQAVQTMLTCRWRETMLCTRATIVRRRKTCVFYVKNYMNLTVLVFLLVLHKHQLCKVSAADMVGKSQA